MKIRKYNIVIIYLIFLKLLYSFSEPDPKIINVKTKFSSDEVNEKFLKPYHENRVHRAGALWLNVTNIGQIGTNYLFHSNVDQCTGEPALSAEMPGGSGIEYLYIASLLFGGYLEVSEFEFQGVQTKIFTAPLVSTAFDGITSIGEEIQPYCFDDDPSGLTMGRITETSNTEGRRNCLFEEVYDPKATAYEQFSTRFTDKGTDQDNFDGYDGRNHIPLGIEVKQTSYAWPYDYAKKFIIVDYTIYNRNEEGKDIFDFFMGVYVDSDVYNKKISTYGHLDDICGFIERWDGYIDPATGEKKSVNMNMIWTADNDGREYITDGQTFGAIENANAGDPLDGARGVFSIRILRNPSPDLKYSFNLWSIGVLNESLDWGPRWLTGLHSDWEFDLTAEQKGYDDTNYDDWRWTPELPMYGGRTEGTPVGDSGKYMVMSNGEFDYNQTSIREVYLGMSVQEDGSPISQSGKWQKYTTNETLGMPGFSAEIADGSLTDINDIANGVDQRYQLSFGPLGNESFVNIAIDMNNDGTIDSCITNKKVWKFAYGDSLKLTLAFMVSENFHTSLEQDPNYRDSTVVDLSDGLDISLYDQGWYDAFYNVVWAERVFDTPMFDTPETRWGATKKDGWFGEDVGADAMFGDVSGDTYCWWMEAGYSGPDDGEGDFEMSTFTNLITDCYGDVASTEDELLPFGRKEWSGDFGTTGNSSDGEGYGYMVKYDKLDGAYPQGTWVRYGFDNGRLDAGDGVPDFSAPPPPPSPKISVREIDNEVIVEWCSHEFYRGNDGSIGVVGPEFTFDPYTRQYDFEGYSIEISPDRQLENFTTVFSVDRVNYSYQNVADVNDYLDNPILADTMAAHPEDYPVFKAVNNNIYNLVKYGDNRDLAQDHELKEMFSYTCRIDSSQVEDWGYIRNYKFILYNQTLAQMKYIAVTASDFGAPKMGVPSLKSSPESNATATVTANVSTTEDVIVVPNPYRGDIDYTEMGWEDIDGQYIYAEEYRKIAFLNIPERCLIKIYTLTGDLCKTIAHNGNSDSGTPYWYGKNGAYWNLINENHQAVMSGIYLFSVQDADKKKDDFVGKFVIIK